MAKLKDDDHKYKCEGCKATFKGFEVKLSDVKDNIEMIPLHKPIMMIDKNGDILSGSPEKESVICSRYPRGDKVLHCPKCNQVHLFGFEKVQ